MNWGGFAQGFGQGFNNGVTIGKAFNDARKQAAIDDVRAKGMEEAKTAREGAISGMIKDNGIGTNASEQPKYVDPDTQKTASAAPPKAGDAVPDTADTHTYAVPPQPALTPIDSPQAAIDAAPARAAAAPVRPVPAPTTPTAPLANPAPDASPAVPAVPQAGAAPAPAPSVAASGIVPDAVPVKKRYSVGDASFDTIEEARAHAAKSAPSQEDLFLKNGVPKIRAAYIEQGNPQMADAWSDYADKASNKQAMKDWAKAMVASDFDTQADRFGKFYTDHIDDGVDYVGHKIVTKEDGSQVATVDLKDKDTGKVSTIELSRERMLQMAMENNPQALFEKSYAEKQAVDAARVKNAMQAAEDQRKLQGQVVLEGVKAGYQEKGDNRRADREDARDQRRADREESNIQLRATLEASNLGAAEKAKAKAKIDTLKSAGWTDEEIKPYMPAIVGAASDYKKSATPEESRRMVLQELLKDPIFSRKKPDEQQKILDQNMALVNAGAKPAAAVGGAAQPAPAPAAPTVRGIPAIDTKTGKQVLLDPVTRKPIQ